MTDEIPKTTTELAGPAMPAQLGYARGGGTMVPIATFPTWLEASMICVVLDSQNIRAKMLDLGTLAPNSQPGTVTVPAQSVENAVEVLASTPARRFLIVPPDQIPPAKVMKVLVCPKCESENIGSTPFWLKIGLGVLVLAWMPAVSIWMWPWFAGLQCGWMVYLFMSRKWQCRACNHTWAKKPDDQQTSAKSA